MARRRPLNLMSSSLLLSGLAILFVTQAQARPGSSGLHKQKQATEARDHFLGLLPWHETGTSIDATFVRRLSSSKHPLALRRLLTIASELDSDADPRLKLALVRALHLRSNGIERKSITKALMALFSQETETKRALASHPDAKESPLLERQQLQRRLRSSAALALAHSKQPEALRFLFAKAAQSQSYQADSAESARQALLAAPPTATEIASLGKMISPDWVRRALKPTGTRNSPLVANPIRLAKLSKRPAAWIRMVASLTREASLPQTWQDPKLWKDAYMLDATWTLRALTCLSDLLSSRLKDYALQKSRISLSSSDDNERSAAAWTIATLGGKESFALLDSNDPVIVAALLRQGSQGPLASRLYTWSKHTKLPKKNLRSIAAQISLLEARIWSQVSNQQLWEFSHDKGATNAWRSPLASRMTAGVASFGAPSPQMVRSWLMSQVPSHRSAALRGLAELYTSTSLALLLTTYRNEGNLRVRRGICRALGRRPRLSSRERRLLMELEPDSLCRTLAAGTRDGSPPRLLLRISTSSSPLLFDEELRPLPLVSAPDHFVGVVFRTF